MILTTHALAGAAIGKNLNNIWLIIVFSVILHFVFDSFRHGEYVESFGEKTSIRNTWWKVGLDLLVGFFILYLVIFWNNFDSTKTRDILIGSLFSILPDFLTFIYWKFNLKFLEKIYKFHSWIHKNPRSSEKRKWNFQNAQNDIVISIIAVLLFFI